MSKFRGDALNLGQQIRIEHQLQHMFGMGPPLELGVGDFVAEGAEIRRAFDAFEKVRPTAPIVAQQRPLEDDLRPACQSRPGCLRILGKVGLIDLDHCHIRCLELGQMGSFVGIALLLEQRRIFGIFARHWPLVMHIGEIERGRVSAAHEPHQIRCGQEYPIPLNSSHYRPLVERNPQQDLHLDRLHVQP